MVAEMNVRGRVEGINRVLEVMDADFNVEYSKVSKNNGSKEAFVLRSDAYNCAPTIYPDERLLDMEDMEIAHHLVRLFRDHAQNYDMTELMSKEHIMKTVMPKVVSISNRDMLEENGVVYREHLDMAVCYYFPVHMPNEEKEGFASVQITKSILEHAGMNESQLYEAAIKHIGDSATIESMQSILKAMMGDVFSEDLCPPNPGVQMLVVSNKNRINGAAVILSSEILRKLKESLGDEFVILPSSIHECIAVSGNEEQGNDLINMVKEVNRTQVSDADRLTDNVYFYKDGVLTAMM